MSSQLNNITAAVQTAFKEVALKTLDVALASFKEKFEVDDAELADVKTELSKQLTEEYKVSKQGKGKKDETPRKKREPSEHNIWIKNKMAELKEKDPELKGPALMKKANELYRESDLYKQKAAAKAAAAPVETAAVAATPQKAEKPKKEKK